MSPKSSLISQLDSTSSIQQQRIITPKLTEKTRDSTAPSLDGSRTILPLILLIGTKFFQWDCSHIIQLYMTRQVLAPIHPVLYGSKPRLSIPAVNDPNFPPQHDLVRKLVARNTFDSAIRQKYYHDLKRRPINIREADLVYVYNHGGDRQLSRKLKPIWTGPHWVSKVKLENDRPVAIEILDLEKLETRRVSFNDLKEAYTDGDDQERELLPGELLMKYIITYTNNEEETPPNTDSHIVSADYDPLSELLGNLP